MVFLSSAYNRGQTETILKPNVNIWRKIGGIIVYFYFNAPSFLYLQKKLRPNRPTVFL